MVAAFGGAVLFSDQGSGMMWLLSFCFMLPTSILFDSSPGRRLAFPFYVSMTLSLLAMVAGMLPCRSSW